MSLLPLILSEHCLRPTTSVFDEFFQPGSIFGWPLEQVRQLQCQLSQIEPDTTISFDKKQFQASVDVQQFTPEEIKVRITGDREITVEGKHEEKKDEHGYISRHFVRRYVLPGEYDLRQVQPKLSSDGVLTISAPRTEGKQFEYTEIPIQQTGQPVEKIEKNEQTDKGQAEA